MSKRQKTSENARFILIANDDFKSQMWRLSLEKDYGYSCKASKSAVLVLSLVPLLLSKGKVESVVFRYLNDRKSILKSITFLVSDWLTCVICRLFQIKIHWILHNIDKESSVSFPMMVRLRRNLISARARKIYVTDSVLCDLAKEAFPDYHDKIDHVSFGSYVPGIITRKTGNVTFSSDMELMNFSLSHFDQLIEIIKNVRSDYELIAFCGGRYSKKRTNFQELKNLVGKVKEINPRFLVVVVSDFSLAEDKDLFEFCSTSPDIMFVNNLIEMNEFDFKGLIDFYWSGYSDISIPYTVYTASSVQIPILSYQSGILPKVLAHYKIGEVVKRDYSNLESILKRIADNENYDFEGFLSRNSWKKMADKIDESLND